MQTSAYRGVHLRNIEVLVGEAAGCKLRSIDHIKRRYSQRAQDFELTFSFLTLCDVCNAQSGELHLSDDLPTANVLSLADWLFLRLLTAETVIRDELVCFLRKFKPSGDILVYKSTATSRSEERFVRNFLMELHVVVYDSTYRHYFVRENIASFFEWFTETNHQISAASLAHLNQQKDDLGLAVELAVVEYEKKRLGDRFAWVVEHVALRHVAAGYDVRSLSISSRGEPRSRYIEVKAVPASNLRFHWSQNEIDVARRLGEAYYFYLVPVISKSAFDFSRLTVIPDPAATLLGTQREWIVESAGVVCCLKQHEEDGD